MTTIAYKDGIIAYDSRITVDHTIEDDDYNKMRSVDGVCFFFAGSASECQGLIDAYFGKEGVTAKCTALVVDQGEVFECSFEDGNHFWKFHVQSDKVQAIGSGSQHATTAMDCGLSAKEAVKMAIKRDTGTGGKVRIFRIKK